MVRKPQAAIILTLSLGYFNVTSLYTKVKGIPMKMSKIIGLSMACLLSSSVAISADTTTATPNKQIESVVHDYIMQNPEVIIQSLQGYQQKQIAEQSKKFENIQKNAPKFANELFHQSSDPVAGNPKGAITVVEFFDYQCPHCIDMTATLDSVLKTNPNVKVVLKEFPIRGAMSEMATRAALAANKQGKYFPFHLALMSSKTEPLTENAIYDIAKSSGLNVDQLKKDMKDPSVDQQIKTNYKLAKDLEIIFTPVFFIAKSDVSPNTKSDAIAFIPGQISAEQLADILKKIGA